jgi:hypothetical protein
MYFDRFARERLSRLANDVRRQNQLTRQLTEKAARLNQKLDSGTKQPARRPLLPRESIEQQQAEYERIYGRRMTPEELKQKWAAERVFEKAMG